MTRVGELANTASQAASASPSSDSGFNSLDTNEFLKLLISELQNQDPLNPMDNGEMVQQIGQIRSIGATDDLTGTLSTLRESQDLVTASGLIGQKIQGLADDASAVDGVVDRVTVDADAKNATRKVKVHVGDKTMDIKNIRTILTG
jgi:flagellar basal-body rod modification protein FlgD